MSINKKIKIFTAFATTLALSCSIFLIPSSAKNAEPTYDEGKVNAQLQALQASMASEDYKADKLIVTLAPEYSGLHVQYDDKDFKDVDVADVDTLTYIPEGKTPELAADDYTTVVSLSLEDASDEALLETAETLLKRDDVESAYLNVSLKLNSTIDAPVNDTYVDTQWALKKIQASEAWAIEAGETSVKVGVIDTGVDFNHEDLHNLDRGKNFVDTSKTAQDIQWHGTAVTGIIAANTNNNKGIAGISPNVTIVPLMCAYYDEEEAKEEDRTKIWLDDAITAVQYAIDNKIDVINFSAEGKSGLDSVLPNYEGVFVVAAGNTKGSIDNTTGLDVPLENRFISVDKYDNVIKVAATNERDELSNFSSYGVKEVAIAAPGEDITSTLITGYGTGENPISGYTIRGLKGTSFSAPYVAGVAALLKSYIPELTSAEILECIVKGGDVLESLNGKVSSSARLNALGALKYADTLDLTVNKDELQALITQAEGYADKEADYTADSWKALQDALTSAKTVMANEDATRSQVNTAVSALRTAIDGLKAVEVPAPVKKDDLQALITKADGYKEADYTAETWKAFQSALTSAKAVLANDDATQTEVDTALAALELAITNLRKAEAGSTPSSTTTGKTGSNPKTGDASTYIILLSILAMSGACVFMVKRRKSSK